MISFIKRRKYLVSGVTLVIIILGSWAIFGGSGQVPGFETALVERGNVTRVVSETGTVSASDEVDLAFTVSGRVASVPVAKGSRVSTGQTIVRLDAAQAQATLRAAEARAVAAGGTSSQVIENARIALLREDLQAYMSSSFPVEDTSWSYDPPTISGTYTCTAQGEYKISFYASGAPSGWSFTSTGLETDSGMISTSQPQPLGSCGLFLQFPENFVRGNNIVWVIPVPNTRSATYASRLATYQAALSDERNAPVYAAEVEQARAALANMTLVAPFGGIITSLSATPGEIVSPGTPVASLVSADNFEITLQIPEDDIIGVETGDKAKITFDALRDLELEGTVAYVAPAASRESGFAAFEVVIHLSGNDPRVRSGLTADVDIYADSREGVIAVPVRAVIEEDGVRYIRVMDGENSFRRVSVSVGLRGDGMYEITSGLSEGESVITFANTAALDTLVDLGLSEETTNPMPDGTF